MDDCRITPLASMHARTEFSSGNAALDDFLRHYARQYEKRSLGQTYVATTSGREEQVLGYYTLAAGSVPFRDLPNSLAKRLPKHPVPVILLGRLAVDRSAQGRGLGRMLMVDALNRARALSRQLGVHAVEVVAIDEAARTFYLKYGFEPLLDDPLHLFLPISTIEKAFRIRS